MRRFLILASLALAPMSTAAAQGEKADPRAVEYCKAKSKTFVAVAACLPDAHVSIVTLDAFEKIYPAEAHPIKTKCLDLNKGDVVGGATCVTAAVEAAIGLKKTLPDGADLGDAVYTAVAKEDLGERLNQAEKSARSVFPDKMFWGGGRYIPYK